MVHLEGFALIPYTVEIILLANNTLYTDSQYQY